MTSTLDPIFLRNRCCYKACFSMALLYTLAFVSFLQAEELLLGRVVGVTDGDTIVLLDEMNQQNKIRLSGIDAPEKGQAFGQVSKEHLSYLIYARLVSAHCTKVDHYGRLLCVIMVDGRDANLAQVEAGLAWHYKQYEQEQTMKDRERYAASESLAREGQRGLWSEKDPIPPWDWRHQGRR